jgi:hypothetical protein
MVSLLFLHIGQAGCNSGRGASESASHAEPAAADAAAVNAGRPVVARHVTPPEPTKPSFVRDVSPLIGKYCLRCHDSFEASGDVALDVFSDDESARASKGLWVRVADRLRSGKMPPPGEAVPSVEERETLNAWLDAEVPGTSFSAGQEPRRATLRRLNRAEYDNTIRDLLGIDLRPADDFPADDVGYGFDNIGDVLSMPPVLLEQYLAAAETVIEAAFRNPELRGRIMNPVADAVPQAFRKIRPPVRSYPDKRVAVRKIVVADPELKRQQGIYDVLRAFADRAFRRPATHNELSRLLGIVLTSEKDGESSETGIQLALEAILVSPQFLFQIAADDEQGSSSAPIPENDFDLAARLSYFLWSSMPDEEVFRLAAQGTLRRFENLASQVRRMLQDPKAHALVENFAGQWLQTRNLKDFRPDPNQFPDFDEALRAAMLTETALFCGSIMREDRSVLEFLDADYTFVNESLARHYGIPGVQGDRFQRVSLAGTPRGGILTQASILTITSHPTRTSPVKRGKWILDTILGAPPSPPPPGFDNLNESQERATATTLRLRMEQHRANPECRSCHGRIDPLGFGLENFDAVGRWRTQEADSPIDASGRLPEGQSFQGPAELRSYLKTRQDAFTRCLAEKLLTYALARGLDETDTCELNEISRSLARNDYRFSALVLAIVQSQPFQMRRAERGNR